MDYRAFHFALVLTLLIFSAHAACAEDAAPATDETAEAITAIAPTAGVEGPVYSNEMLDAYALATQKIQAVQDDMTVQIENTTNIEERDDLYRATELRMESAVTESQLSLDDFNAIAQAAQSDATLSARITEAMKRLAHPASAPAIAAEGMPASIPVQQAQ